jgi:hypothetical protein
MLEAVPDAFADVELPTADVPKPVRKFEPVRRPEPVFSAVDEDDNEDDVLGSDGKPKKKGKGKGRDQRRTLIYDEDIGATVAKRRRKGSRGGWDVDE